MTVIQYNKFNKYSIEFVNIQLLLAVLCKDDNEDSLGEIV